MKKNTNISTTTTTIDTEMAETIQATEDTVTIIEEVVMEEITKKKSK